MGVERPNVSLSMEAFGGSVPTTDAYPTGGGVFKIDEPGAIETPCQMVSIATTSNDAPKITRHWSAWDGELPNDNLNQPF